MIAGIVAKLVAMLWPAAPAWVSVFVGSILPVVFEVVEELEDIDELEGSAKFDLAIKTVADAVDDAFDSIPEWSDLSERQRDRIVQGLVELAVFIQRLTEKDGKRSARRQVRSAARTLKGR